jgi:hypothetical protein
MSQPNDPSDKKASKQVNSFLRYTSLGLQIVITLAVAGGLGFWIDSRIGWQFPVFLLLFLITALIGVIYLLIKQGDSNDG